MNALMPIIRRVLSHWKLLIIVPILTGLAIIYLTRNKPLEFESVASLYLHLPTQKGLSLTDESYKQFEISTYFQNIIELSRSRKNLDRIRLQILHDAMVGKSNWIPQNNEFPWTDSLRVVRRIDWLLTSGQSLNLQHELDAGITIFLENKGLNADNLSKLFRIFRKGNSNYLQLASKHNNPFLAAYFNGLVIQSVMQIHKSLNRDRLQADRSLFEKLVAQALEQLNNKISILENYKIKHQIINLPEHTKAIVNQMVNLEMEFANLNESLESKKLGLSSIKSRIGKNEVLPTVSEKNKKIIALKKQIANYRNSDEKDVEQLRNMIKEYVVDVPVDIRTTKQELIQQYLQYGIEVEMTEELLPLVNAELNRIRNYAKAFAPFESNISTMEREIQTAQESYLILINKLNMAKTVEAGTGKQELTVVDEPTIPIHPSSTKRKIVVIAAALVAFILVMGIIVAQELLDQGMWNITDMQQKLGLEVIAGLPSVNEILTSKDEELKRSLSQIRSEQYRSVGFKLLNTFDTPKEICISSAFNGEGRHELAIELRKFFIRRNKTVHIQNHGLEYLQEETQADVMIHILPPSSRFTNWLEFKRKADVFLYLARSGRVAQEVDHKFIKEIGAEHTFGVLHAIPSDYLDDLGMNIVKSRSGIRVYIKRLLQFQFKFKNQVSYL